MLRPLALLALALAPAVAAAQHSPAAESSSAVLFAALELPFLGLCIVFAFMTARALRGGVFGTGMNLLAWGFLVMAVGHLHMQVDHFFGFNLFETLLGPTGGAVAWFVALVVTWGLSGYAFYRIYSVSRTAGISA